MKTNRILTVAVILLLLVNVVMLVFMLKKFTFSELSANFFASLFYVHNIIYDNHSKVLGVAWSLEVEAQFYILAPLLCLIFICG